MNLSIGIKGEYEITVLRNGIVNMHYEFKNMLLDVFLDRWSNTTGIQSTNSARCFVGAGTTPPVSTDTQLQAFVAASPTTVSMQHSVGAAIEKIGLDYWATGVFTFTFNTGQVVGNISEVGISMNSGTDVHTNIDSRALIKDNLGNPVTITLTAADQLVVRYKLRMKIPTTPVSSNFTIDGVSTTVTWECLNAIKTNAWSLYNMIPPGFSAASSFYYQTSALKNNPESGHGFTNGGTIVSSTTTKVAPGVKRYSFTAPSTSVPSSGSTFSYMSVYPLATISASGDYAQFGIHFDPAVTKTADQTFSITYEVTLTRL